MAKFTKHSSVCALFVFLFLFVSLQTANSQELKVEEIIAKHLESIGKKEKLDAVKNKFVLGVSEFESKQPNRKTGGKMLIVSEGRNLFFLSSFNSKEYPFEKIGYFSDKIALPFVTAGARSPLGAFIAEHEALLSEGLFAGNVSTTWNLVNSQIKKGKIKSGGTKKIDGKKHYVLEYYPNDGGSAEFTIKMFFDTEKFYHTRTEYFHMINPRQDTFGSLGRQAGLKMSLTEDFGDFKQVDGVTLPHSYKIDYLTDSNSGVYEFIWTFKVSEYRFNQKLDPNFFKFDE